MPYTGLQRLTQACNGNRFFSWVVHSRFKIRILAIVCRVWKQWPKESFFDVFPIRKLADNPRRHILTSEPPPSVWLDADQDMTIQSHPTWNNSPSKCTEKAFYPSSLKMGSENLVVNDSFAVVQASSQPTRNKNLGHFFLFPFLRNWFCCPSRLTRVSCCWSFCSKQDQPEFLTCQTPIARVSCF